jgi:DNA (cytosine-5)-methyltransferase 1
MPTSRKPKLLDLFCGAGGASKGYAMAGFDVTGVDIKPQPNYPHRFDKGDALEFLARHWWRYDAVHASPPCQGHSRWRRFRTAMAERGNETHTRT